MRTRGRYDSVGIVLVGENTEGPYGGFETVILVAGDPTAVASSTAVVTRTGCERIARCASSMRSGRVSVA